MAETSDISAKRKTIDFTPAIDDFRAISRYLKKLLAWRPQWPSAAAGECLLDELNAAHLEDIGLKRFDNEMIWVDSRGAPLRAVRDHDYRGR